MRPIPPRGTLLRPFLALTVALALGACDGRHPEALDVGLVFDIGGRGDKSFNDSAYAGLERAEKEWKLKVKTIEPSPQTSREAALRRLAEKKTPLVLGIGIYFSAEIARIAREFPAVRFVCIDYDASAGAPPANLLGITFREHEGSYLVGAVAGLVSKTGKLGFVGGMEIPLIKKFEAGFLAGARAVRPGATLEVAYAGNTGEAWKNPPRGKELALGQYARGAEVIFHASGSTGLGVFKAAQEAGRLAIGVDADQSDEAPDHVLTSMIKRVDEAVYQAIRDARTGKWKGGLVSLGLAEKGVDYVYKPQNQRWITAEIRQKVEALRADVAAGKVQVPAK